MTRVLQCVALPGFSCVVFRTTSWILAGVIVEGLPGRGASLSSATNPPSRNRFRQRAAFSGMILNLAAICLSCIPPAASRTIRARSTLRAEALRARARDSSMSRCSVLSTTGRATRGIIKSGLDELGKIAKNQLKEFVGSSNGVSRGRRRCRTHVLGQENSLL